MKSLIVHEAAEHELWDEVVYYENEAKELGLDFLSEAEAAFRQIQEHPQHWQIARHGTVVFCWADSHMPFSIENGPMQFGSWPLLHKNDAHSTGETDLLCHQPSRIMDSRIIHNKLRTTRVSLCSLRSLW
jgi:hypothetical protein